MNLIYFDNDQLLDFLIGDKSYNEAYRDLLNKNTVIFTGKFKNNDIIICLDGNKQIEVKIKNVKKIWIRGKKFPYNKFLNKEVFNCKLVEELADNKAITQEYLHKLMPLCFNNIQQLEESNVKEVIVKPIDGLKGKGIYFTTPEKLNKKLLKDNNFVVQEVIKSDFNSKYIKSLIKEDISNYTAYDIRLVITDSNISLVTIRLSEDAICNAARGAKLIAIQPENLDRKIRGTFEIFKNKILKELPKEFKNSIFSVDFTVSNNKFKVFELNSYPGIRPEYKTYLQHIKNKLNETT